MLETIGSESVIAQSNAQLQKLVDVVAVEDMTSGDTLARELLLIKLQISAGQLAAVDALLRAAGGKALSSDPGNCIVELAGTELEIAKFIAHFPPLCQNIQVLRTGAFHPTP